MLVMMFLMPALSVIHAQDIGESAESTSTETAVDPAADPGASENPDRSGVSLEEVKTKLPPNLPRLGINETDDPLEAIERVLLNYVITPLFSIVAGIALIMVLYSSFQLVISRGEEEGITTAKTTLIWSAAGLALTLMAYTIVRNISSIVLNLIYGAS